MLDNVGFTSNQDELNEMIEKQIIQLQSSMGNISIEQLEESLKEHNFTKMYEANGMKRPECKNGNVQQEDYLAQFQAMFMMLGHIAMKTFIAHHDEFVAKGLADPNFNDILTEDESICENYARLFCNTCIPRNRN